MTTSPSQEGTPMTSTHPIPPLPQPQPPAAAAGALADAAGAAARAWAQPLHPDRHQRAVSQLYSTLRDLGIAARGLAVWQVPGTPEEPAAREFTRHVTSGSRWYLGACICLDEVAFEGLTGFGLPDPDEPGAALCRAARNVILAWRLPSGGSEDRDVTVRAFITATGLVSAGALGLSACAPRRTFIGLQAVIASLAEVVAALSAAVGEPAADPVSGDSTSRPLPATRRPGTGEVS
jgi:hypothetical protein